MSLLIEELLGLLVNEESEASKQAKQFGWISRGGKWYDAQGNYVARTVNGKLQKVSAKPEPSKDKIKPDPEPEKPSDDIDSTLPTQDTDSDQEDNNFSDEKVRANAAAFELKTNKQTPKQKKKEQDKNEYFSKVVDLLTKSSSLSSRSGKYELSRDDLKTYSDYLKGNKPKIPDMQVGDDEIDLVVDMIKERVGTKGYAKFINKAKGAGAPPPDIKKNIERARAVIKHYISTGGVSEITGEVVPFYDSQLDHKVSLVNGGVDGPENWQWMEARYNQFKKEFTDDVLMGKINKLLSRSEEEIQLKNLEKEYNNYLRGNLVNYFKTYGFDSISVEDIQEAKGARGQQFLKSIGEAANIPLYKSSVGSRTRGTKLSAPEMKERILDNIDFQSREQIEKVDDEMMLLTKELTKREEEVTALKKIIAKQKIDAKKNK